MFENMKQIKKHLKTIFKGISLSSSIVGVCLQIVGFFDFNIPSFVIAILFICSGLFFILLLNMRTTIEEKIKLLIASDIDELRTIRNYLDDEIDKQTLRTDPTNFNI